MLIALAILIAANVTYAQENGWELKRKKDNLEVYVRNIDESGIKELKIKTQFKASLNSVYSLFEDVPRNADWVYSITEAKVLEVFSPTHMTYYSVSDFPWPLSNRDVITESHIEQDPETKVVKSRSVAILEGYPKQKGMVRVTILDARWIFTPLPGGILDAVYIAKSDPGGNIPVFLTNIFLDRGPIQTIINMREMLKLPEYRDGKVGYLEELEDEGKSGF